MKNIIMLLLVLMLCSGCYESKDTISIAKDGLVSFESEIMFINDIPYDVAEKFMGDFLEEFGNAGWDAQAELVDATEPVRYRLKGVGNLFVVRSVLNRSNTHFYKIQQKGEGLFSMEFATGKKSDGFARQIKFTKSSAELSVGEQEIEYGEFMQVDRKLAVDINLNVKSFTEEVWSFFNEIF